MRKVAWNYGEKLKVSASIICDVEDARGRKKAERGKASILKR